STVEVQATPAVQASALQIASGGTPAQTPPTLSSGAQPAPPTGATSSLLHAARRSASPAAAITPIRRIVDSMLSRLQNSPALLGLRPQVAVDEVCFERGLEALPHRCRPRFERPAPRRLRGGSGDDPRERHRHVPQVDLAGDLGDRERLLRRV